MSDVYGNSSPNSSTGVPYNSGTFSPSGMSSQAIAIITTTIVVGGEFLVAIAYLVFKYLQKKRQSGWGKITMQNMERDGREGKILMQSDDGEGKITMQNMESDDGEGKISMQSDDGEGKITTHNMQSDGAEGKISRQNMQSSTKKSRKSSSKTEKFLEEFLNDKPMRFTPEDKLGSGGFGKVFKYIKKRRQKRNGKTAPHDSAKSTPKLNLVPIEKFMEEFSQEKPMRFTPQDLQTFTDGYKENLGSGGFGEVFKGRFPNGIPVAVKVLREFSGKMIVNDQFAAELGTVGRTNHINLVRLYGFCFHDEVKALVYEYMENGSLQACLDKKHSMLDWATLYKIALGTARGIRYLHEECKDMIIHYDIRPANVLLDKNFSPKVADFGLAEIWDRESILLTETQGRGTPGFVAPELSVPLSAANKCDVYSFGMVLFEILGSRVKMQEGKLDDCSKWVREKAGEGEFELILSSCGIQEKERTEAERMCKVALVCVQLQPEARPAMNSVVRMLEGMQEIGSPLSVQYQPAARHSMISVLRMLEGMQEIGLPVSVANGVVTTGADQVKQEQS